MEFSVVVCASLCWFYGCRFQLSLTDVFGCVDRGTILWMFRISMFYVQNPAPQTMKSFISIVRTLATIDAQQHFVGIIVQNPFLKDVSACNALVIDGRKCSALYLEDLL